MFPRTTLFLASTALVACMTVPPPAAPEGDGVAQGLSATEATRDAPVDATPAPPAGTMASVAASSDASAGQCRMTVSNTENCTPAEIEALIAPARQSIEECAGPKGGKVVVRLRQTNGRLSFDVEPNASLDPTERRCILDALAKIPNADGELRVNGEPRANGFTSLVTIEW